MKLADNKATVSFQQRPPPLSYRYSGGIGPDVIDIRKLYGQTGMFTYDRGFPLWRIHANRPSLTSMVTKGELLYRGCPMNSWQQLL